MSDQDISLLVTDALVIMGMGVAGLFWFIIFDGQEHFEWFMALLLVALIVVPIVLA